MSKQVFWSTVLSVKCCQSRVASLLFAYSWQSCSDSELQLKKERGNQPSGYQSLKASKFKAKTPDDPQRLTWDHSAMFNECGLPLRARPGEWFLALLCACQILPVAIHRTSFKGSASEQPVRHQSTSEWSGCTNQFSQDISTDK